MPINHNKPAQDDRGTLSTYNISKLVQLPIPSGMLPLKLFPRTSLKAIRFL